MRPSGLSGISAVCGVVVAILAPAPAGASGFNLYEQSAEGLSLGSAVSASTTEPAAAYYNPAALAFLPGAQASAGGIAYFASERFTLKGSGAETAAAPVRSFIPTVFATARVADRVGVGLGVFSNIGLGLEWPDAWVGRRYGIKGSMQTATINPVVAYRLHDTLSVAAGVDVMRAALDLTSGLPAPFDGAVRLGGATWGFGGNLGVLYRPRPGRLHVALAYRSRIKLVFDGRADFSGLPPELASKPELADQAGSVSLTAPDMLTLGVMVRPTPSLTLGCDGVALFWSVHQEIRLQFAQAPDAAFRPRYHDAMSVRLGADWATPLRGLSLRAGFAFDQKAAPEDGLSPLLPESHTLDVSAGVGYARGRFKVDLGYMLVNSLPSTATPPADAALAQSPAGTYHARVHLLGIGVTVRSSGPAPASAVARAP
ncbi:MAG TPA: outer membrane protein transport protein [Polyangia bacterium]|jgi:long-chain fatty acid transport protein